MSTSLQVGKPGNMGNAAARAWNTRFGLYQAGSDNVSTAPPDRTGYAYTSTNWPSQTDALGDFTSQRGAHANYGATVADGNAITGLGISNAYNPTTTVALHTQFGADRRLAVAPIVSCAQWEDTNHQATVEAWACILMLHPIDGPDPLVAMEYEGLANDPTSPCATSGVVGGAGSVGPLVPGLVQ
jgi:hypothetical protein